MFQKIICTLLISVFLLGLFGVKQSYATQASPTGDIKSSQFMFDLGVVTHKDIKKKDWSKQGINFIFGRAITIMAATIGGAAVLVMVIGGLMIMFAGVHQDWREKGINMLKRAAIGLFFVLGAYILVTTIQLLIKSIFTG